MKILTGIIIGVVLVMFAGMAILYSGFINMAATTKPSRIEEKIGHELFERSMEKRASNKKNPYSTNDPAALASGIEHYQENCLICHGAPGVEPSEIGKGLNPSAPVLDLDEIQEMNDGQLYWTIENGIRMTGMPAFGPTHSADEIWKIVAFVRHLPELSDDEKTALASVVKEEKGHHHEAESKMKPEQTQPRQPAQTRPKNDSHEDHTHDD
jgi:mono/diheme cytochrome c family protein